MGVGRRPRRHRTDGDDPLATEHSDFLVPSCIAAELRPRLRSYLGIRAVDSGGLEALLVKNLQSFSQLELTALERNAFLLTTSRRSAPTTAHSCPVRRRSGRRGKRLRGRQLVYPGIAAQACPHGGAIVRSERPRTSETHSDRVDTDHPDRDRIVSCRSASLAPRRSLMHSTPWGVGSNSRAPISRGSFKSGRGWLPTVFQWRRGTSFSSAVGQRRCKTTADR